MPARRLRRHRASRAFPLLALLPQAVDWLGAFADVLSGEPFADLLSILASLGTIA